ncbi:peptidase inhibitor family I36 protein [Terrabacter sp. Ter38]|uniref:peptidase inhibitor family I36 protein n=1 Tax=Terrabacter sp. Ter38 TaxID=2926030 RepID=UPI0021194C26|nr:peptidase inhibitor family I36 protein [Terrabacter sp. Ter38]
MGKFSMTRLGPLFAVVLASVLVLTVSPSAATAGPASGGAGALQHQIDLQLAKTKGGVQISDNAVAYNNGDVIVVFPNPGQRKAPAGIGSNVRNTSLARTAAAESPAIAAGLQDCPDGFTAHSYCFYTDVNWGGRRLQFQNTCVGKASDFGFDNQTSSWVNNNPNAYEYTYDGSNLSTFLWSTGLGASQSSWVGATNNDRMSSWAKHGDGC